jgi:protein gp37
MSGDSAIEWTDATWNPTTGCDKVSAGCDNCYAMSLAPRLKAMGSRAYQLDGAPATSGPGFLAHEWPSALEWPLHKKKPLRIFVNSMSDLFHENISDEYIAKVFAVMAQCPQHTFQILTKRHARMRAFMNRYTAGGALSPLPNVWLGVSVEDQKWADIRIPALLETPAAVRFLSCEPLLGPVSIDRYLWLVGSSTAGPFHDYAGRRRGGRGGGIGGQAITAVRSWDINWVIVGGESGPGARPMDPDWARLLRDECEAGGVPFLFKQWGSHDADGQRVNKKTAGRVLDGRTWDEYPKGLA